MINVITDQNNIYKLLLFINPSSTRNRLNTFTINIKVTKNTVIFYYKKAATYEFIRLYKFKGYSYEFEKANTTNQINSNTRHHRIILYYFDNLNFIIYYKTDRYIMFNTNIIISSLNSKEQENNSLSSLLESLSLSSTNSPLTTTLTRSRLIIKEEGQVVLLKSTLELKTYVSYKPL